MEWTPVTQMTFSQLERQERSIYAALTLYRNSRSANWCRMMQDRADNLRATKTALMIDSLEINEPMSQINWYRWSH